MNSYRKSKKELKDPDSVEHGYNYAIFLLGLSMRTSGEIKKKMTDRGYSSKVITEVIASLEQDRYLNDEEYVSMFIETYKTYRTYGWFMLKKKLIEKYLPVEFVEAKLGELLSDEDEYKIAERYAEKNFGKNEQIKNLPYEQRQKFLKKLVSRGIRMDTAMKFLTSHAS